MDPKVNSGVQIRCASRPDYRKGVVHGYQIEIDPSERGWSGGIYDEQRRGWLPSPKDDPAARKAFKAGEWNRYRVEAAGDRLRTWVNDVPVSDLVDGMTRSGFIGFQVHQAEGGGPRGQVAQHPHQGAAPGGHRPLPQHAHRRRARRGLAAALGRAHDLGLAQREGPGVSQGGLGDPGRRAVRRGDGGAESRAGGDIVTDDAFAAFELQVEFRLTAGGQQRDQVLRRHRAQQGRGLGHRPRVPAPRRRHAPRRQARPRRQPDARLALRPHPGRGGQEGEADRRVERGADRLRRAARRALAERRQGPRVRARARRSSGGSWP